MTVDNPDYVGATILHHGQSLVVSSGAQVIAPGATYNTGDQLVTKPGYWVFFTAIMAAAATNPFVLIEVTWKDAAAGNILDVEQWVVPAGTPAIIRTNGRGPVTGAHVLVKVTNLDAVQNMTIHFNLYETTHAIGRHDWRSQINANWTSISINTQVAPCAVISGSLFQGNPSIPANSVEHYQLGLYAGQVWYQESDTGASNLVVSVAPTQDLETASALANVYAFTGAAAGVHGMFTLPRQPCLLSVNNPNAAAVVCNLNVGILEYAS